MNWLDKLKMATPYNVANFLEGTYNVLKDNVEFLGLDDHIKEQALWRASRCASCLKNGECFYCGCDTPDVFYASKKVDAQLKWGPMLTDTDWEVFKSTGFFNLLVDEVYYDSVNQEMRYVTHYMTTLEKYSSDVNKEFIFINYKMFKYKEIVASKETLSTTIVIDNVTETDFNSELKRSKELFNRKYDDPKFDNNKEEIIHIVKSDYVDDNVYLFGDVTKGEQVQASFTLKSIVEKGNIKVVSTKASCGCTKNNDNLNSEFKPGESKTFNFTLDTSKKNGHTSVSIIVSLEHDKKRYDYSLVIKGNVN
jgi:hypothetical protein